MTTAHVEKFAELVGKDPSLLAKLGLDKVNADAVAAAASVAAYCCADQPDRFRFTYAPPVAIPELLTLARQGKTRLL